MDTLLREMVHMPDRIEWGGTGVHRVGQSAVQLKTHARFLSAGFNLVFLN